MLAVQSLYFVELAIQYGFLMNTVAGYRMEDILMAMIMTSYTLMYIGFSRMVAKAYEDMSSLSKRNLSENLALRESSELSISSKERLTQIE